MVKKWVKNYEETDSALAKQTNKKKINLQAPRNEQSAL
jgi:hypothetical protein